MKKEPKKHLLYDLFPLNDAEIACKQFRAEYPEKRSMSGEELRAFLKNTIGSPDEGITDSADSNLLIEDELIPSNYNVTALRHLRYLPCCLHSHDFFEINCVLSGSCEYQTPGKSDLIGEGDIVIFPPHKPHSIDVCSDDCILINILARSSTFDRYFFSIFNSYDILTDFWSNALYGKKGSSYLIFRCGNDEKIRECVLDVYRQAEMEQAYQSQMLDALFHLFLISLLQNHEQDIVVANPEAPRDDKNFISIMNCINEEYKTLALSELAEKFYYSERQMIRILKEYTGMSFGELIRNIKLKRASDLLRKSNISLQAVVETVGYSDISHLYRVFKKEYNCTPTEYRTGK